MAEINPGRKGRFRHLGDMGELGFLDNLRAQFRPDASRLVGGLDDDCAVFRGGATGKPFALMTCDVLVEGTHFNLHYTDPASLGWKSLMVNASDIAAMAGRPTMYVVGLAAPAKTPAKWLDAFSGGLRRAARKIGATLAGGDTVKSECLVISVTLLGEVNGRKSALPLRSNMRKGDYIYATGTLGDSAAGLEVLQKQPATRKLTERDRAFLAKRHLKPRARLAEAQALGHRLGRWALIDLSDDLLFSLDRLANLSGRGYRIDLDSLPVSPALRRYADIRRQDVMNYAAGGGEDFELLFTCRESPDDVSNIFAKAKIKTCLTYIGRATAEGSEFLRKDRLIRFNPQRFIHF